LNKIYDVSEEEIYKYLPQYLEDLYISEVLHFKAIA